MPCPHLREVVMLYCDAYPVKKMVPLDRLVSTNPCIAPDYRACPLFRCATGADQPPEAADGAPAPVKEALT